ncbi:MAG: hypothetical protein AB1640_11460 [bacterium]
MDDSTGRGSTAQKALLVALSVLAGFGAGVLLTFLLCFAHAVVRHGGLW